MRSSPIDGVSFAHTFADGAAASRHVTQYYEMLGCRALYHDGWKAVVFHPLMLVAYDGSDPRKPFDEDEWELYHVAEDFSEIDDLADEGARAARGDDRAVVGGGRAQPGAAAQQPAGTSSATAASGASATSTTPASARCPRRSRRTCATGLVQMTAELDVPTDGDADGVIVDPRRPLRRLRALPPGRPPPLRLQLPRHRDHHRARGRRAAAGARDREVHVRIDRHIRRRWGRRAVPRRRSRGWRQRAAHRADLVRHVGLRGRVQTGPAITSDYDAPFRFTAERLGKVTFDVEGRAKRDPAAQERIGNAIQ